MKSTHSDWIYIQNPFDSPTQRSYKLLDTISKDHVAKLLARASDDPRIADLHQSSERKYRDFVNQQTLWALVNNQYNQATSRLELLLSEFSGDASKMENWAIRVQIKYNKTSIEYQRVFFPEGRSSFSKAGRDELIRKLRLLNDSLAGYADLADVYGETRSFLQELETARNQQQVLEQNVRNEASKLRLLRETLVEQLGYNKDMLSVVYRGRKEEVINFYPLELIRRRDSKAEEEQDEIAELVERQSQQLQPPTDPSQL